MSRCSSPKGALTLVLACPQPRGSTFHRIVDLKYAFYGWSQVRTMLPRSSTFYRIVDIKHIFYGWSQVGTMQPRGSTFHRIVDIKHLLQLVAGRDFAAERQHFPQNQNCFMRFMDGRGYGLCSQMAAFSIEL